MELELVEWSLEESRFVLCYLYRRWKLPLCKRVSEAGRWGGGGGGGGGGQDGELSVAVLYDGKGGGCEGVSSVF